jgi:pimeloyl-ACP methyl ester carboxylesterase
VETEDQTIQLNDGRTLGFAQYGAAGGHPVLYFTGGNRSRLEGRWFATAVETANVTLIVPDRPGFGLSDLQPQRKFLDWPTDIRQLIEALQIDRFGVFGLSGGAPHVAAVAHQLPTQMTRAAIISGVAPPEMPKRFVGLWPPLRLLFFSARYLPRLNRFLLKQMSAFYADPHQMMQRMKQALPQPDVQLLEERPEIITIFSAAAQEAHRAGIAGDAWEWHLYNQPWGFRLSEIQVAVGLWYGQYDRNVPVGMGHYWAQQLPQSRLHVVEDGGHFSTINNHIGEILAYLTA